MAHFNLSPQISLSSPDSPVQMHLSLNSAEVCESLIHAISEKEMRLARNAYNRSGDLSEEYDALNSIEPACVCHDANENLIGSNTNDPDEWEYGDGDQSPMDQKVWYSKFCKSALHLTLKLAFCTITFSFQFSSWTITRT